MINDPVAQYPVTGDIKFLGAPVIGAVVSFAPKDGQPAAVGRTDDSDNYFLTTYDSADGAAAGNFSVVVMKFETATATADGEEEGHSTDPNVVVADSHAATGAKDDSSGPLLPPIFANASTTTLKAEVKSSGENKFDFELK